MKIAFYYYEDENLWAIIYRANLTVIRVAQSKYTGARKQLSGTDLIFPGTVLEIPDMSSEL